MGARQYSDDDRATALAFLEANRGNFSATARQCGISRNTLRYWASGGSINAATAESSTLKKADLAALWQAEAEAALAQASIIRQAGDASYRDLITAAGIATDKLVRLRGSLTMDQVQALLAEILASVEKNVDSGDALRKIASDIAAAAGSIRGAPEHAS